jgi:hypothetical protein
MGILTFATGSKDILGDVAAPKSGVSSQVIAEMLAAVDIVEVMERDYDLILEEGSNGWHTASCPMPGHRDTSPSFGVNREKGTFNCFGCSAHGNLLDFMRKMEGLSFGEALQRLSLLSGIGTDDEDGEVFRALRAIKEIAREFMSRESETHLPGGISAVQFSLSLAERLRAFEKKTGAGDLEWVDSVYREADRLLIAGEEKELTRLWKALGQEMKSRAKAHAPDGENDE